MDVIRTIGLSKSYGTKKAVNQIDLIVPERSIYGFIGRNGSGKSTTQKMICGLASPGAGEIQLFGKPVSDPDARRQVGTLIEQPGIYPGMSALDNVVLQGYSIGIDNPRQRAVEALETVGLGKSMKKKAKALSLGMKQRLGLAVAMLGSPKLLVLDEPINGLDPEGIVHFRQVIEDLNKKHGVTIFISSHILGELSKIATHYGIIKEGRLVRQMTAEQFADEREDYLMVKVNNAAGAIALLKKELRITEYQIIDESELHILGVSDTSLVNRTLAVAGFHVTEIYFHQQDLEEYFIDLMGGSDYE